MNDKKDVNYTHNDGAKYRYSAPRDNATAKKKTEKVKEALTKRAVFWRTNKAFAAVVLVAVILLFSFISVVRAASRRAGVVEEYYPAVRAGVTEMTAAAKSLASVSEAVGAEGAAELREAAASLEKDAAEPFWENVDGAKRLHETAEAASGKIYYGDAGAEAKAAAKDAFEKIDASYRSLGSSAGYREAAEEYNDTVSTFPVSLLGRDRAPVFEKFDGVPESAAEHEEDETIIDAVKAKIAGLSTFQIIVIVAVIAIAVGSVIGKGKK